DPTHSGGARTVLEVAVKRTGLTPNTARALLGRFLFSGEEVDKPLEAISGGERQRLSLAILVASGANVLVLDEPTNHLDLESREALEDALRDYPGTLLLVSHDRALLDAVGSRTIAVEDHALRSYVGGWDEYLRVREERKAAGVPEAAPPAPLATVAPAPLPTAPASTTQPSKNARRRETELERAIEQAEASLAAVEQELADPAAWATKYESAKSTARHTAARRAVEQAYAALEEHVARFT
ncbi:MAG TPA: ATP-binding cassette domain-containing protein, partial [Solirubrobacteraceae bacterium]|nr:ATP-binding cassette domain-containing protein [Solirubrobacteraceae bacterium]